MSRRNLKNFVAPLLALSLVSCAAKTAVVHPAPFFASKPLRQATNAVDAGDGDMEIASLRQAVTSRPDDVNARLHLAQAYAARGFADVALEHLRLASERFPDSLPIALQLAKTLRHADQKEQALLGLKAFIHTHPQTTAEPYEWLGILNDDLQNWKDSRVNYETALLYAPASAELHNNLGNALMMQHLNNAAAVEFRAALRIQPNLPIASNNLGIALAGDSAVDSADRKDAILNWQASSGPAVAHNNMAALLMERGDWKGARKELDAALSYDRQNGPAIFNLALVAERDGKPAVLPSGPAAPVAAKSKEPGLLVKLLHPWRTYGSIKPAAGQTAPPVQSAERSATPAGSGN